jgi:type III secretion protein U
MSDDKTKPPTEHRLQEARDDGEVANSPDATAAVSLVMVLAVLTAASAWGAQRLELLLRMTLDYVTQADTPLSGQIYAIFFQVLVLCVPLALFGALGAILGVAIQGAVTMAFKKVEINIESVDPVEGMKRIFSSKTLVEGGKLFLKLLLFGALLWATVRSVMPLLVGATARSPSVVSKLLWEVWLQLMWMSTVFIGLMAAVDYKLQHWLFMQDKRMSEEDIKRENKEQNGNPEIKQKQKEISRELLEGDLPAKNKPDVVLANPTHYSVALSYLGQQGVPVVIAKGKGEKAFVLRRWAQAQGIPVIEHPALARRLFLVAVGDPVPRECYHAVAVVLQWVKAIGRTEAST